jgi:drug/metabolite transporter (DMT)-like permease
MSSRRLVQTSAGTHLEAFGPTEWLLVAALSGTWGASFLLIAIGLDAFEPGLVTALRVALGAAALTVFRQARAPVDSDAWPRITILALLWIAIPFTLFPIAQQWISSALAGMLNGALPILAASIAAVLLRRLPGSAQIAGIALGFLGVVFVTVPSWEGSNEITGILLVLAAVAMYGLATNIAVPLQQQYGALPVAWRTTTLAAVFTLPVGIWAVPGSEFAWGSLVAVAFLGVAGTGLALAGMTLLVGRAGATRGSIAIYFIPIVAAILGVVFRDEEVTGLAVLGMALVLLGAFLASRRET